MLAYIPYMDPVIFMNILCISHLWTPPSINPLSRPAAQLGPSLPAGPSGPSGPSVPGPPGPSGPSGPSAAEAGAGTWETVGKWWENHPKFTVKNRMWLKQL